MEDFWIQFPLDVEFTPPEPPAMSFTQTLLIGPDTDKVLLQSNLDVAFEIEVHSGDLHVTATTKEGTRGWACITPVGKLAWTASLVEVRSNEGASYQFTLPRIGGMA